MEGEGTLILWRSEHDLRLRYTCLIADGDVNTHNALVTDNPYDGLLIVKHDCISHVQKRMALDCASIGKRGATAQQKIWYHWEEGGALLKL